MSERHSKGGLVVYFPWGLATVFGPLENGNPDDPWRSLWNGSLSAERWAEIVNGYGFGRHVFAFPIPETGDTHDPHP